VFLLLFHLSSLSLSLSRPQSEREKERKKERSDERKSTKPRRRKEKVREKEARACLLARAGFVAFCASIDFAKTNFLL
jgi:hypothetical protein